MKIDDRLKKQIEFILEIDKEKQIYRQTHISGNSRYENDAEHAWHMAIMAYLLKEYSNNKIDIAKTMMMILIHDIVEIDAGDTYAYDEVALKTQKEREEKASKRLFGLLPDDQREELTALFNEFEENITAEAKFAHAMDNFQPLLLNDFNNGLDWKEHNVSKSKVLTRQSRSKDGSQLIYDVSTDIVLNNVKKGNLKDD